MQIFSKGVDDPREFRKTAKVGWVSIKRRKSSTAALKEFVKMVGAKRYYAKWVENTFARDDSIEVLYEEPTEKVKKIYEETMYAAKRLIQHWEATGRSREELLAEFGKILGVNNDQK